MDCIYCRHELVGTVRPAHIVPEGMGGRLTSRTTVCNDCNNSFANIEGTACERLARRFARYDEGDFFAGVDTETAGSRLPLVDAPYVHAIEIWTSGSRLNYRMVLFKELTFVGTLSESWGGSALRGSYSFNVQRPTEMQGST